MILTPNGRFELNTKVILVFRIAEYEAHGYQLPTRYASALQVVRHKSYASGSFHSD